MVTRIIICFAILCTLAQAAFFQVNVRTPAEMRPGLAKEGPVITVQANADWRGTVTIRNQAGRLVRVLYVEPETIMKAGQPYEICWDGADDDGFFLPDGEYTVRVEAVKASPDHNWGGRYFQDHYLAVLLDPRGDSFCLAGINSRETLFTHDEYPEALLRRFDFDGLPVGPEIPLEAVQLEWGSFRPCLDIHGDVYLVDGFQNVASAFPRLYKIDGKTGELLWTSWGIIDNATGKQRPADGSLFDGRKIGLTGHAHLWDTDPTVWVGSTRTDDEVSELDSRTGNLIRRVKVPLDERFAEYAVCNIMSLGSEPGSLRVAPDGTIVTATPTVTQPLIKMTADGRVLWELFSEDRNRDGDLFDPPDVRTGLGELRMNFTSDVGPIGIDVEGNVYGTAQISKVHPYNVGVAKYDPNGQLLLWAQVCYLAGPIGDLDVSTDGKTIASVFKHSMYVMVNQADYATGTVRIAGSPAKDRTGSVPATWQTDIMQRLGTGQAGELNRGRLAMARKQHQEAIRYLEKAAGGEDPDISSVAFFLLGCTYERLAETDKAVVAYERCGQRWKDQQARALIQAARCLKEAGRNEDALKILGRAEKADNRGFWAGKAVVMRTEVLRLLGRHEEAILASVAGQETFPLVSPNLIMEQGETLLAAGKPKEAVDVLVELVRHYPIWTVAFRPQVFGERRAMRLLKEAIKCAGISVPQEEAYLPEPGTSGDLWPDQVLGQENLAEGWYIHGTGGSAAGKGPRYNVLYPKTIAWPLGLYSDGTKLIVAGYNAGRICFFDPIPKENFPPTSLRVGEWAGWHYMTLPGNSRWDFKRTYQPEIRKKQERAKKTADMTMNPVAVCSDGTALFVTDSIYSRVLVFNKIPDKPDAVADFVLGQPNLLDGVPNSGGISASSLKYPYGAHCDGKRLWVADRGNHRVLMWTLPIRENFQKADLVLGQDNFSSSVRNAGGISSRGFNRPGWVFSDGNRLAVSDTGNHRVLIWKTLPTKNNQPADLVLGQKDFTASPGWNLLASGYIGKDSFSHPTGLLIDEGKLYVCDSSNNRVLVWNTMPVRNGQPADQVIGQPDLEKRWTPIEEQTWYYGYLPDFQYRTTGNLYFPIALAADRTNIYLSDFNRCRILIYRKGGS